MFISTPDSDRRSSAPRRATGGLVLSRTWRRFAFGRIAVTVAAASLPVVLLVSCSSGPPNQPSTTTPSIRGVVASAVCSRPDGLNSWGSDVNAIGGIYYECGTTDGGEAFVHFYASAGAEELFAQRISGLNTGGQRAVLGDGWIVESTDQAALTAALNLGGQLL